MAGNSCGDYTTGSIQNTSCCQQEVANDGDCTSNQEDKDCCPAMCICACIPITVVNYPPIYVQLPALEIVVADYPPIINHFFEFIPNIWQPPRLN